MRKGGHMLDVRQIATEIVVREGGFVNDPADPGGPTNHGVTLATLQAAGRDLTGDGRIDIADVQALTREDAIALFLTRYFDRPGLSRLPEALQPQVFDMYVNAGAMAVKILQRVLKAAGHRLRDDGILGPATLAACEAETDLPNRYAIARRDFYYALAEARPASRKYACRRDGGKGGWITRAESFLPPALRLTEAQHRARTAHWH